ncbi:polymer-forming cytoskeletal protein [Paenibacillus sp. ACRRX]|uniref:bactofilin family protein n=1 Tax=Paenibacillus sp. ACRRX TaxID=2918206 RepID=UPI001EF6FEC0|nr:polymer-forming cytoskeletal protein [Paenibacillus sp. ACRRX]MCG7408979.1 polymer-forming cytoskeletal protein [Paenibacillus sp. ACRRX]
MLGKSKSASTRSIPSTDTLISYGTEMEGIIHSPSNLRIDGAFKGEIRSDGIVVIGEKGEAHSNIEAQQIIIAGKVFGELKSSGKITITPSGIVSGNCESQWLVIQEGGILNGSSQMERLEQAGDNKQKPTSKVNAEGKPNPDHKVNEKQAG